MTKILILSLAGAAAACSPGGASDGIREAIEIGANDEATSGGNRVVTTGKTDIPFGEVPAGVLAAALDARPGFTVAEAEAEVRDGRRYFDIGGTLPDGTEVEFDIMQDGRRWRVVETQRDIAFAAAPEPVRAAYSFSFAPTRVIESTQADGLVIYELFGTAAGSSEEQKVEIKWDGHRAEVLTHEWAH
ncbi:hypothetical protein [Altericroceibacterium xinjiangense]|uniref:hypothetical protein n=1 Tax=Altericroceibacterium xinjiangense TaxID=762261 RepID=UPI0019D21E29|nr:hypothetical protein [Altericroceibacterium xinjiangense]